MSTLSVPLTSELEKFITDMVRNGRAVNKADVVRKALIKMSEDEAVAAVLRSEQDERDGKVFYGDLPTLVKQLS
jgi:putative addiction module CopG family antidote